MGTIWFTRSLGPYRVFKQHFHLEPYLTNGEPETWKDMCRLRTSSHSLLIESLRGRVKEPEDRICQCCPQNVTEDENHFLMECTLYEPERLTFLNKVYTLNANIRKLTKQQQFIWLMSNENNTINRWLGNLIRHCFNIRKQTLTLVNKQKHTQISQSLEATHRYLLLELNNFY